jgi:uncharacterized protein (TIGR02996 family)
VDDEAAFLRAICTAPSDDAPRLAFADWLDEHGDAARAELIRQITTPYTFPPGQPTVLTYRGESEVAFDVPVIHPDVTWIVRMGFACGVRLTHQAFLYLAETERLFARCPIEAVQLIDRTPHRHNVDHRVWFRAGPDEPDAPHALDPRVFAALTRHPAAQTHAEADGLASFLTTDSAVLAASWALVNVGREIVGLPPLGPP